jgi:hypothetical protein
MEELHVTLYTQKSDDEFIATFVLLWKDTKISKFVLRGADRYGKDAWNDFIAKRVTTLLFVRGSDRYVCISWDGANIKFEVIAEGETCGASSKHYFPAEPMLNGLRKLAEMMN